MSRELRSFGPFRFYPETGELFRRGERVDLQNQPGRVLALLTRRQGELVTREEIRESIWGGDTHVDFDRSLNFCIRRIRLALEDSSHSPVYLETLPRRGYRFIAPVTVATGMTTRVSAPRSRRALLAAAAFSLGLLGGAAISEDFGSSSMHRRLVDWLHQRLLVSGQTCPWAG